GAFPAGGFAAVLTTGDLAAGDRASCFACRAGALAGAGGLAEDAEVFGAGFRAAAVAFAAGRFAAAGLGCARPAEALRRAAAGAALPATRLPAAWRVVVVRLAAGFAAAFGFGRRTATRRVAVACLAGAAVFFAFGAGRAGLPAALPAEARFPDPLAGLGAFMPAISPFSTSRERGAPSTRLRVSLENLEPAIPRAAEPEPA
ncbi:MAG: hypothetical protein ICV73_28915, partial [Acetobacteraceae bacterium]|nr:hypothetical protein [Acetobacteraceae bacterium]